MMNFIKKIFIFETQNLILNKSIVCFSVFLFLESLFLFFKVTNYLRILSYLFLLFVVHFKQLNFCIELLFNVFVIISEIYESVSFKIGNTAQFFLLSK